MLENVSIVKWSICEKNKQTYLITGTNVFDFVTALNKTLSNIRGLLFDGDENVAGFVIET